MTLEKLYEFVEEQYIVVAEATPAWAGYLNWRDEELIKEFCKIILTNFTLTDLNARH